jgi:hypothetical protein
MRLTLKENERLQEDNRHHLTVVTMERQGKASGPGEAIRKGEGERSQLMSDLPDRSDKTPKV